MYRECAPQSSINLKPARTNLDLTQLSLQDCVIAQLGCLGQELHAQIPYAR